MKEHRTKALRVTTPHSIENGANHKDEYIGRENANDLFGTLQILQFELVPSRSNSPPSPLPLSSHNVNVAANASSSKDTSRDVQSSISSRRSHSHSQSQPQSQMLVTTHTATATFTASPAFGKQDSFYRWFSSEFHNDDDDDDDDDADADNDDVDRFENDNNDNDRDEERKIRQYACEQRNFDCGECEKNFPPAWKTCHCRLTLHERKIKHRHHHHHHHHHHNNNNNNNNSSNSKSIITVFQSNQRNSILDLVSGDLNENWFLKIRDIKEAISREKNCCAKNKWHTARDANGNTALLVSGQKLLREGSFDRAVELAKLFLDEGSDVNVINNENRTLLSYSIQYMDGSIRLTTLLINYGANVWPMPASVELPICSTSSGGGGGGGGSGDDKYGNSSNNCNSAFTWFLRSIIRQLKLSEHCLRTLYLLAEVMGENPDLMHSHVMSTMFSHAKCYSILGPVFLQIKLAMSPYWTQPQSLKFLCKSVIRKSIISVPGRFVNAENVSSLMLPPSLQSYLMLENNF